MDWMLVVVLACSLLTLAVVVALAWRLRDGAQGQDDRWGAGLSRVELRLQEADRRQAAAAAAQEANLRQTGQALGHLDARMEAVRTEVSRQLSASSALTASTTEALRAEMASQLTLLRQETDRQLDAVRATVDEKLTRTLNDRLAVSFRQINEQLEAVHQGLGAMQGLASSVGDLKRVLSNVKTRGILGEVQLGAILREVLAPGQYEENVATRPGSQERVEFAVRIPTDGNEAVLLPIDAKFPADTYAALLDAQEQGDPAAVTAARRALVARLRQEAKDIATKYVQVPQTTNFALLFLPFEGLYAEVVSTPGLVEGLQRDYAVNVAGPSTMAALLNSLQLSYQTIALQRQTDEVLQVLQAVKAELPKYQAALMKAKRQIDTASGTVDSIIHTRTNQMERTLRNIALPGDTATTDVVREEGGDTA